MGAELNTGAVESFDHVRIGAGMTYQVREPLRWERMRSFVVSDTSRVFNHVGDSGVPLYNNNNNNNKHTVIDT